MRTTFGMVAASALSVGLSSSSWGQGSSSADSSSPLPSAAESAASTVLIFAALTLFVIAIIAATVYLTTRRQRIDEAVILQSQLSDALAREAGLRGLYITARAHVVGWRRSRVMLEVTGDVPTPELRETVMRIAAAEAQRIRPGVIPEDHLFIVPPTHRTGDPVAPRG
jgi:hypothetical protein